MLQNYIRKLTTNSWLSCKKEFSIIPCVHILIWVLIWILISTEIIESSRSFMFYIILSYQFSVFWAKISICSSELLRVKKSCLWFLELQSLVSHNLSSNCLVLNSYSAQVAKLIFSSSKLSVSDCRTHDCQARRNKLLLKSITSR